MSLADRDIVDRFNALDIGGTYALNFAYRARQKFVLLLMDGDRFLPTTEDSDSNFYELQFNRVLGGQINVAGPAPGDIIQWRAHRESELLAETLRNRAGLTYGETFVNFELTCEESKFNLVARDFFLTVVNKATYKSREGSDGTTPAGTSNESNGD